MFRSTAICLILLVSGCATEKYEIAKNEALEPLANANVPATFRSNMSEVMSALLDPRVVQVSQRSYRIKNGAIEVLYRSNIWFSRGEFYLRVDEASKGIGRPAQEEYNYVTQNGRVYEWAPNAKAGKSFAASILEVLQFYLYMVDPAGFRSGIYLEMIRGRIEYRSDKTEHGRFLRVIGKPDWVLGVEVLQNPFWIRQFRAPDPELPQAILVLEATRPTELLEVPIDVRKLPDNVDFQDVDETVFGRMGTL